jgi:O-antigen/teichoic acid export membrane protein
MNAPADRGVMHRLFLRGSFFELAGFGVGQALRLGSNLVFTRLLFPSAFGLTMMVAIIMQGLTLLSDVGIQQAVIQNPKGDEPRFLNTAWTMQVIRSSFLSLLCAALAYPMAHLYREPLLGPLLLVAAFQLLLNGFHATSLYTLRRRVASGLLSLLEIAAQVAGIAATATWSMFDRSVWALVAGAVAGTVTQLVVSHFLPVGYHNKLGWDRDIRNEIIRFGRWILASSAVFFFARQADRLLLGRFMGAAVLGVYSIAVFVSEAVGMVSDRITAGVLYPIFSRLGGGDLAELKAVYYRTRLRMDAVLLPGLGVLAVLGDELIKLLWDPRYQAAGWMLRILVIRVALGCIFTPCETCLTAIGNPRYGFLRSLSKALAAVVGIPIGYKLGGLPGLVWATALSELPSMLVLWPRFRQLGLLRPARELLAAGFFLGGAGLAWLLGRALGLN